MVTRLKTCWHANLAFLCGLWMAVPQAYSAEPVVATDPYNGFAIEGFDPVTYFTESEPQQGQASYEVRWGGTSWRFINSGNARAFLISPRVFIPQFSGYDPFLALQGFKTPGDPQVYALFQDKLYLFHNDETRTKFMSDVEQNIKFAKQAWQRLIERD